MFQRICLLAFCFYTTTLLHAQHHSQWEGLVPTLEKPKFEQALQLSPILARIVGKTPDQLPARLRSGSEEKLDSVVVDDRDRITFEYDAHGHLSRLSYAYKFFPGSDWEYFFRIGYVFTPEGLVLEETYSEWDDVLQEWNPSQREVYSYLPAGVVEFRVLLSWDLATMDWAYVSRTAFSYLPNGRLAREEYQSWEGPGTMWSTSAEAVYQYNASGLLEEIGRNWFDPIGNSWLPWEREAFHYNPSDQLVKLDELHWSEPSQDWLLVERYEYTYNAEGLRSLETFSYFDSWNMVLTPGHRETFEYDDAGNMASTTFNYWDEFQGGFIPEDRRDFEYDLNTPLSSLYFPHIWNEEFIHSSKLLHLRIFGYTGGSWQEDFIAQFYYSPVTTSLLNTEMPAWKMYPNPASDFLVLESPRSILEGELTLIHVSGLPVLRERVSGATTTLAIRHIPAGCYVLQFRAEGKAVMSRPVVIHH